MGSLAQELGAIGAWLRGVRGRYLVRGDEG